MASTIEDIIDEIEEYIENCKPASIFSDTKITVNRDDIEGMLEELRSKTPEEIRRYQKIISNKEAILADAQKKADQIIADAQITTNELVSEHQIMQQAYAQANEVVMIATKQSQEIMDAATRDANEIRAGAIAYTDQLLNSIQDILTATIDTARARNDTFLSKMQGYLDVVVENRSELAPETDIPSTPRPQTAVASGRPQEKPAAKTATAATGANGDRKDKTPPVEEVKRSEVKESAVSEDAQKVLDIPESFFKKD